MAVLLIATGPDREGCTHPARLAIVARKVEPWGHFIVARISGTRVPHDYRLPLEVPYFPDDAVEVSAAMVEAYWHHDSPMHPVDIKLAVARAEHKYAHATRQTRY